jgi:ABC-2 type transport system permease protein
MREALALVRASWLHALSYRLQMVFSTLALLASIVPLYFVSRALQPMMADSIRYEGQEYFAFVMVGLIMSGCMATAVNALHGAVASEISTGAFEALLATPIRMPSLLLGLIGHAFSWIFLRSGLLLVSAWLLGAQVVWGRTLEATAVLLLTIFAYLPLGVIAAAAVLAFRTTGPFPSGIVMASGLLGGVYYPTTVIPSWLADASLVIPLGYGLRALRRILLDGLPITAVAGDLLVLTGFAVGLLACSIVAFSWSVGYAKRAGTLAQY